MKPFERTRLGRTDVEVTRLGLGLAPLGGLYRAVGDEQASATLERAWELGFRYFDTAPLYGDGLSERRAGSVLAGKPRTEFTLSTKVGDCSYRARATARHRSEVEPAAGTRTTRSGPSRSTLAPVWDFTADGTRRSYAESLDRLGLDRADVLHIHDPDDHYADALAGALPALVALRARGPDRRGVGRHEPGRRCSPTSSAPATSTRPARRPVHPARPVRPGRTAAALRRAGRLGDRRRGVQLRPAGRPEARRHVRLPAGADRGAGPGAGDPGGLRPARGAAAGRRDPVPARASGGRQRRARCPLAGRGDRRGADVRRTRSRASSGAT